MLIESLQFGDLHEGAESSPSEVCGTPWLGSYQPERPTETIRELYHEPASPPQVPVSVAEAPTTVQRSLEALPEEASAQSGRWVPFGLVRSHLATRPTRPTVPHNGPATSTRPPPRVTKSDK